MRKTMTWCATLGVVLGLAAPAMAQPWHRHHHYWHHHYWHHHHWR